MVVLGQRWAEEFMRKHPEIAAVVNAVSVVAALLLGWHRLESLGSP
jgi:hypothetical protein